MLFPRSNFTQWTIVRLYLLFEWNMQELWNHISNIHFHFLYPVIMFYIQMTRETKRNKRILANWTISLIFNSIPAVYYLAEIFKSTNFLVVQRCFVCLPKFVFPFQQSFLIYTMRFKKKTLSLRIYYYSDVKQRNYLIINNIHSF